MRKETRIKRLKQLKYLMDNHAEIFGKEGGDNVNGKIKFDIDGWSDEISPSANKGCGTAACALGSACYYKPFNKAGLKIIGESFRSPSYKNSVDFSAGAHFFGIHHRESSFLFSPSSYKAVKSEYGSARWFAKSKLKSVRGKIQPKHVSERIALLIKHYNKTNEQMIDRYYD